MTEALPMNEASFDLQATHGIIIQLEQAKSSIEEVIDHLPDLFAVIFDSGRILKLNQVMSKMLGTPPEEAITKNFSTLFSFEGWQAFQANMYKLRAAHEFKSVEFELPIYSNLGEERVLFWYIRRQQLGKNREIFYVTGRDISVSVLLAEKNAQLQFHRKRIQAILDNSLQGFFTFNRDLQIESDYSTRAEQLLGSDILGKKITDVLGTDASSEDQFSNVFFNSSSWDLLKNVSTLEKAIRGRQLKIDFVPILEDRKVKRILGTITDVTALKILEQKNEKTERTGRCVLRILQFRTVFAFILEELERLRNRTWTEETARDFAHTIKGEFSFFEFQEVVDILDRWQAKWERDFSLGDMAPIYLQIRTILDDFLKRYNSILNLKLTEDPNVERLSQNLRALVQDFSLQTSNPQIYNALETFVGQPIGESLEWLNSVWLITANERKKKVNPITWASSAPVFTLPYSKLFQSIVHLVRNAAIHGIEKTKERSAKGKPLNGSLTITLSEVGDSYHLIVADDGVGFSNPNIAEQIKGESQKNLTGLSIVLAEAKSLSGDVVTRNGATGGAEIEVSFKKIPLLQHFGLHHLSAKK